MRKSDHLRLLLEDRISKGDYLLKAFPTERELAAEADVSRMTARKVMVDLIERGKLMRGSNGRAVVARHGQSRHYGLLVPSVTSPSVEQWRLVIDRAVRERGGTLRTVMYTHWADPAISEALESLDANFLYCASFPVSNRACSRLFSSARSLVAVERDLTQFGVPSIVPFPSAACHMLLDHLGRLGSSPVDCFNVQGVDANIEDRINQWRLWRAAHRVQGNLIGDPRMDSRDDLPIERAHIQFGRYLDQADRRGTAVYCTTGPAAIGAIRAIADRNLVAGKDISVVAVNDEGLARFLVPSITSLVMPDCRQLIEAGLDWMSQANTPGWSQPLLLKPAENNIFIGESAPVRQSY